MASSSKDMSDIASFYAHSNILITGGTGFLGQILLQKILSACPDVEKIYLIIRQKRQMSAEERLENFLKKPLFDKLRKRQPDFRKKIYPILGDVSFENLGLLPDVINLLKEKIHIVFHVAASVRFDDPIKTAVNINIRGTRDMIEMCKEMKKLKCMMYVSTAYSFCPNKTIHQHFYDPPMTPETIITLVNELDESQLTTITTDLLGRWPNTYTFVKSIAETYLKRNYESLPVGIFRPSIVLPTYKDPEAGWVNNLNGPLAMSVAVGAGLMHVIYAKQNTALDLIPADYCINALLVSAVDTARQSEKAGREKNVIYNYVSTPKKGLNVQQLATISTNSYRNKWFNTVSPVYWTTTTCIYWYYILVFVTHIVPGVVLDGLMMLQGKKPRLMKIYDKIHQTTDLLAYFTTNQWNFDNSNLMNLWNEMNPEEKLKYPYNMDELNWDDYFYNFTSGIKKYIMKDKMDAKSQDESNIKHQKITRYFRIAGLSITFLFGLLIWKTCYPLLLLYVAALVYLYSFSFTQI